MVSLREIMTTDLVTVSPDLTLQEVAQVFAERRISGAPVVSGKELVGVISTTDLVDFETTTPGTPRQRADRVEWGEIEPIPLVEGAEEDPPVFFTEFWDDAGADVLERFESDSPEWNRMAEATVGGAMTTSVVSLPPDASVQEAAQLMLAAGVHRILVLDESGELLGLVSTSDIVRAVADRGMAP